MELEFEETEDLWTRKYFWLQVYEELNPKTQNNINQKEGLVLWCLEPFPKWKVDQLTFEEKVLEILAFKFVS